MKHIYLALAGIFLLGNVHASTLDKLEHYVFRYESGDVYEITLTANTITWSGLEGSDIGRTETDAIERKNISKEIEVIQWSESGGAFITLVFDRSNLKLVSSGQSSNYHWLTSGIAEEKAK